MMGDLVLTEDEVNPVMSAVLDNGLDVTALHNHFFSSSRASSTCTSTAWARLRIWRRRFKPAIDLIDKAAVASAAPRRHRPRPPAARSTPRRSRGSSAMPGEQTGPVYKITIGRPDIDVREHGATINARMGLNTWAAFAGSDADAMVAGDVAMLEPEVTPVLKALRANGIEVVAIHHHMTGVTAGVIFLHYFGTGPAATLAPRSAGPSTCLESHVRRHTPKAPTVLFMCPHGAAKSVFASAYFRAWRRHEGSTSSWTSRAPSPTPAWRRGWWSV